MKLTNALIALAFGCSLALAQEPGGTATRPAADSIKTQVKNLDNDSFDVRTKAMQDLRAAGEGARTELEAATKSESLEVRTRAVTLLQELDDKKSGVVKSGGLKPVLPGEETPREAPGRFTVRGGTVPRPEDYPDPNAYAEALRKWMDERGRTRFPTFVLPDGKDLGNDVTVFGPGSSGSMFYSSTKDGERMTYKSNSDGVTMEIEKKDETGKPVKETYTAKDAEEFKAKYPEQWEKYKPGEVGAGGFGWRGGSVILGPQGERPSIAPVPPVPPMPGLPPQTWTPLTKVDLNQPKLGVTTSSVPPLLDKHLKLKGEGVVIESVFPDSLASRLGIQEMDVLIGLDGQSIHDRDDILRVLTQKTPPATATAKVVREGAVVELSAVRSEKAK